MRGRIAAGLLSALALMACDSVNVSTTASSDTASPEAAAASSEQFTIEMVVNDGEQIYLITDASDGTRAAARVQGGVSTFLDANEARTLLTAQQGALQTPEREAVGVTMPGFNLSIHADDGSSDTGADTSGGNARVSVDVGQRSFEVNAGGGGGSDAGDHAQIRMAGMSAEDTRQFIIEADGLEPGVQQQMLDALGL